MQCIAKSQLNKLNVLRGILAGKFEQLFLLAVRRQFQPLTLQPQAAQVSYAQS